MLITLKPDHTDGDLKEVHEKILGQEGLRPHVEQGVKHTIITVVGQINGRFETLMQQLESMSGVASVTRIGKDYQMVAKKGSDHKSTVDVGNDVKIGNGELVIVAGPCSIEYEQQLRTIAESVKEAGAHILRGGAFKPRTSPRNFEGLGEDALKMLRDIGGENNMPTQTEVMTPSKVDLVADYTDILQIGTRNMQNFDLLKAVGETRKPTVLKRGMSATITEWLCAAEYLLEGGNNNVILCERGIRTFDTTKTRNTTDIAAIPVLREETHLPNMFDPSHGVGKRNLIPDVALAGVAAGADSIHLEVHNDPANALSDGPQALLPEQFAKLVRQMQIMHEARKACQGIDVVT